MYTVQELEAMLADARAREEARGKYPDLQWRLDPRKQLDTFSFLWLGMSRPEAEQEAARLGKYVEIEQEQYSYDGKVWFDKPRRDEMPVRGKK